MSVFHIIMILLATYVVGFMVTAFISALFHGEDTDGWYLVCTIFWPISVPIAGIIWLILMMYALPAMLGEKLHKKLTPDGE